MKSLLMVVPLHPKREPRARKWLQSDEVLAIADITYLKPQSLGPPVYGRGGQLYTCGAINRMTFERVISAWKEARRYKFFGLCDDDVVVETPDFLETAMNILTNTKYEAVGATAKEMQKVKYWDREMDVLMRCWVAVRNCLLGVDWDILWETYELPDWEAAWMHFSGIKTFPFPDLRWSHLVPVSGDASDLSKGVAVEYYKGAKTCRGDLKE